MKMKKVKKQYTESFIRGFFILIVGSFLIAASLFPYGTLLISMWAGIFLTVIAIYVLLSAQHLLITRGLDKQMKQDKIDILKRMHYPLSPFLFPILKKSKDPEKEKEPEKP